MASQQFSSLLPVGTGSSVLSSGRLEASGSSPCKCLSRVPGYFLGVSKLEMQSRDAAPEKLQSFETNMGSKISILEQGSLY